MMGKANADVASSVTSSETVVKVKWPTSVSQSTVRRALDSRCLSPEKVHDVIPNHFREVFPGFHDEGQPGIITSPNCTARVAERVNRRWTVPISRRFGTSFESLRLHSTRPESVDDIARFVCAGAGGRVARGQEVASELSCSLNRFAHNSPLADLDPGMVNQFQHLLSQSFRVSQDPS